MPVEVIMPKVDMDMASGTISAWHVEVGGVVSKGDPLFDIETDKAAMEVEAQAGGILHHLVSEGTEVAIGQPVAWLYAAGEEVGVAPSTAAAIPATPKNEPCDSPVSEPSIAPSPPEKTRATPRARALAQDAGIDLATLTGSGPRGRIQADDIPQIPEAAPAQFTTTTGPLNVTHTPGTGVPLVLIHGFASDSISWKPLEAHLKNRPLIRIDLPCHGKSPNMAIRSFADLVKILRQTFDDLHLDAAHIVAHSLGGGVALALADTRPRNIASLTLIAPGGLGPNVNGPALTGITNATKPESLAPWLKTLVHDENLISDGYARAAMNTRTDPQMRAAQKALAHAVFPDGAQAFDLKAALHRVEMPTRLIWGRNDKIIPWQHALTAPGHVALHLFEATGHLPQFERADEIGKLLQSAL